MKLSFFTTSALLAFPLLVDARHGYLKSRQGTTFDTNSCTADSDCASGCCGFTSAVCEGPCVALQRDGCGHGDAESNANAAEALGQCSSLTANYVPSALAGAGAGAFAATSAPAASTQTCSPATVTVTVTVTAGVANVQTATASAASSTGTQFITGTCSTNSDCASGCCVTTKGTCGAILAQPNKAADCMGGFAL